MRGDRLLAILLLLQGHGRLTAADLAERLEVSERTIYRDLDALGTAGVPVVAERGRGGGISLVEGYRTDLTGLSETEARALFSFGGPEVVAPLGLGEELEGALRKLMAALPAGQRPGAARARDRLLVDTARWRHDPEALPELGALQDAVWRDERVRIRYRRGGGGEVHERSVDPYGLVVKAGAWYLLAAVEGSLRIYRVSRIEAVSGTGETFSRPAGFDLAEAWAEERSRFEDSSPGFTCEVAVEADTLGLFLRVVSAQLTEPAERLAARRGRRSRLRLRFPVLGAAQASLLSFGARIEVLDPPELRRAMGEASAETARLYEGGD
ncbi:MAG TPA: WYL domain-containing protein [Candidatus Dormibacteraeota bacterium]|jgi:predicted DNA-binding transcriptional regulator YafY|nr:WYL domain-containing protein [Candidatus Dormibacteraeota bacterium]